MIKVKNARQLITYAILLFSSFWIFFCLNDSSMVAEGIIMFGVLLLANLNIKSIRDVIFPMLIAVFFVVVLLLSGRFFERGNYNIPYKFAVKFINLMVAPMLASAMSNLSDMQKRHVILTAFGTLFISCLVSIYYTAFVNSYAIRYRNVVGIMQTISFDQALSLPVLFPALLYFYIKFKRCTKHKTWYILLMITVFGCILASMLATAIILTICGIALCLLMTSFERRNKKAVAMAVLLLGASVVFLAFRKQIGEFAYGLTDNLGTVLQGRLRQVIDMVFSTEHENVYSMDRRMELANYSIDTMLKHPLFGVGIWGIRYGVIGYHQDWPDVLGVCGIVGSAIIALVFADIFQRIKSRTLNRVDRNAFYLGCILFFVLGWFDPCICLPELYAVMVIMPNLSSLVVQEGRQI